MSACLACLAGMAHEHSGPGAPPAIRLIEHAKNHRDALSLIIAIGRINVWYNGEHDS